MAIGIVFGLGSCATPPPPAAPVPGVLVKSQSDCEAATAAFTDAADLFAPMQAPPPTDTAYRAMLPAASDAAASQLLSDATALAASLQRLATLYAALGGCPADAALQARARDIAGRAAQTAAIYQTESARLLALRGENADQLAPPPLLGPPYVATATVPIYAAPGGAGGRISLLRKGQRVTASLSSTGGAASQWTAIALNDGSTGYVASEALRAVRANFILASAKGGAAAANDPGLRAAAYLRGPFAASENGFAAALADGGAPSFDPSATPPGASGP